MNVSRLLVVVGFACALSPEPAAAQTAAPKPPQPKISTATKEKAAEENANPDAIILSDFQKRIDAYMDIHKAAAKEAPPLKETKNPAEIKAAQDALGAKIRAARKTAKQGDIMTPEIQNKFRRLMYPVVTSPAPQGTAGREVKKDIKEELKENTEERKEEGGIAVCEPREPGAVLLRRGDQPHDRRVRAVLGGARHARLERVARVRRARSHR